jgi:thiol-disulfide isomerase/thioredoxin
MRNSATRLSLAFTALVLIGLSGARVLRAADERKPEKAPPAASSAPEFSDDFFYFPSTEPRQQKLNELVGKKMPELSVSDWLNGEVKTDEMKGKVVLVDIWATWCGPCIASIPHNNEMLEKLKDKGLVIVGVCSSSRGQEKLADTVSSKKIAYPVCKDPDQKTSKAYNLAFYPTYIAVDRKGIVRAAGLRPDKVQEVVEKLLAEKAE